MNPIKNLFSFKTVYSENKTYLVFSIGKKEEINYSQVQMLENEACREYLLPFQCTKTSRINKISFNVSGLTSLSEYLKTEMSQDEYFEIIMGIQRIISFCQNAYLSYDNLICDPKYMYYHNTLKRILMIYIPLKNPHYICDSIPRCLASIHKNAKRVIITDGNYLTRYENYLTQFANSDKKKGNSFSPDSLLHFFNENAASTNSCIPAAPQKERRNAQRDPDYSINNQIAPSRTEREPVISGGTRGAAVDDMEFEASANPSYSATVVRSRRNEIYLTDDFGSKYDIKNFPFNIGRNRSNDLIIEQATVSGRHAVITEKDGHFFLKDTSTNGTYINNEDNKISSAEIYDGDKIFFDRYGYTFSFVKAPSDGESAKTVMVSRRRHTEKPDAENIIEINDDMSVISEGKALAYLKKISDESRIKIMDFPFESPQTAGTVLFVQNTGGTPDFFVKNVSCDSLAFEGTAVEQGKTAELFSGCSLEINGEGYMFNIEN